ncbi:hypothetical protein [Sinorhizobium meliloti]|uniref:hypothetical protein n=1 Tax=Rhizobium meliloti TaxID=382 RepID=UPI000FD8D86E|nr:hypothetical protein [Sinorhizobium meliloti]RVG25057.1 hypothetical protein CN229_24115 [Sinorhizobium meliloti]
MQLLFLDDAAQSKPSRQRVGPLVAVGGISIDVEAARDLESALNAFCNEIGFPSREPFKWSPSANHWMRENLIGSGRAEFFETVLRLAADHGAKGQVTISDKTKGLASKNSGKHETDVLLMALERFNGVIRGDLGMVIVARPSGGRSDEDKFLSECADIVANGSDYAQFMNLATHVLTMPFQNSRLLQVADLVVSITTAMVAGHTTFAAPVFERVRAMLRADLGRIGGVGVKIHPDYSYANLYHWLLGDEYIKIGGSGIPLPMSDRPYSKDANRYWR